jgi:hypothetical protein
MHREFHIFASDFERRFLLKGFGGARDQEFASLFAAARYARAQLKSGAGTVVVYDGRIVNRIPVYPRQPSNGGGAL